MSFCSYVLLSKNLLFCYYVFKPVIMSFLFFCLTSRP